MPTSVPMFPTANPLEGSDILYLIQGMNLDRDKKVTLETVREFCTAQGVRLDIVDLTGPATSVVTHDVTSTTNVVVIATATLLQPFKALNITGRVPNGCSVVVLSSCFGYLDFRVQGNTQADTPQALNFGLRGRAELVWSDTVVSGGSFLCTIVNDSRWIAQEIADAVTVETNRAEGVEGGLSTAITTETTRAETTESALSTAITTEHDRAVSAEASIRAAGGTREARKFPIRFVIYKDTYYAGSPDHVILPTQNNTPVPVSATDALIYAESMVNAGSLGIVQSPKLQVWHETANDKWEIPPTGMPAYLTGASLGMHPFSSAPTAYNGGSGSDRVNVVTWSPNLGDIYLRSGRTDDTAHMNLGLLLPAAVPGVPAGTLEEFFFRIRCEGRSVIPGGGNFLAAIFVMDPSLYATHGYGVYLDETTTSAGLRDAIVICARRVYNNILGYVDPLKVDFWSEDSL